MEIKCVRKIVPVGLILVALLIGDHPFTKTSNSAWARNTPSPAVTTPVGSETKPPTSDTSPAKTLDPPSKPILENTSPLEETTKSTVPPWLWLILFGLGLWNAALSFLFWQSLKESTLNSNKTTQNLNRLRENDDKLNQRITRKSALIDELTAQLAAHKKTLEVVQLQAKSIKSDDYSFDARNKPASYGNNEPFVSQDRDYAHRSSNYSQPAQTVSEPWDSIVQNYNLSPQVLENYIVERVSESEESVVNRRDNSKAAVFLKLANNYSYCIFTGEDRNYWLTPKSDLKITPIGFDTFQALFECPEYQQGSKIKMIKPAKVVQNSSSGGWDLVEKGQVQFTR